MRIVGWGRTRTPNGTPTTLVSLVAALAARSGGTRSSASSRGNRSAATAGSIAAKYLSFPNSRPNSSSINPKTCADAGLVQNVNCRAIAGQGLDIGSPLTAGLGQQDLTWQNSSNPGVGNGLDGIADIANYN